MIDSPFVTYTNCAHEYMCTCRVFAAAADGKLVTGAPRGPSPLIQLRVNQPPKEQKDYFECVALLCVAFGSLTKHSILFYLRLCGCSLLPDVLVGNALSLQFLAFYRISLANALYRNRRDVTSSGARAFSDQ